MVGDGAGHLYVADTFNSVILNVVKSFPFQNAKGGAVNAATAAAKPTKGLQPISLTAGDTRK